MTPNSIQIYTNTFWRLDRNQVTCFYLYTYHESTENQRKLAQSQHFSTFGVHKNAKDTNRFWRGLSPFSFARVYENAQKSLWAWNEMIVSKRTSSSLHIEHIKTGIYFPLLYLLIPILLAFHLVTISLAKCRQITICISTIFWLGLWEALRNPLYIIDF